jgi:ribosomal protein S18 acetylase RimI-like enzyme
MSNAAREQSNIAIRPATADDVIGIVYVQATTWIAQYPNDTYGITETDIRAIDWHGKVPEWRHMITSPDYSVWVVAEDEHVYGFITVVEHQTAYELYALNILPTYQNQGWGSALIETLFREISADVYLQVATYNHGARRLYERYGFTETGAGGSFPLPGGKTIPTLHMQYGNHQGHRLVTRKSLAALSGVRESTIKWYTEQGLLSHRQQEANRRRYYELPITLQQLEEIQRLRESGYSLVEIRKHLK